MLIRKSLNGFKRGVLALCCFAVLNPIGAYASTSSYFQSDNSTELATYSYDAFGRRIAKTVNGSTTYYLYSGNQLIAELDESGEMVKAYGWDLNDELSSTPLWQAEVTHGKLNTAEYHTLINDHLGTPQMAVNDEGDVTWKAVSESFGKSITDPQNQITMNLRFPGQYYDEETGTHYNYFRDYNPATGRYIQKDPIGLGGGINEYAYAYGNSLKYTDPTGEFAPLIIIAGWGAAEWAIVGLIAAGVIGTGLAISESSQQYNNYYTTGVPPYTILNTEISTQSTTRSRNIVWPRERDRRGKQWLCTARADCNDNIVGNCPNDPNLRFEFGSGQGVDLGVARNNAKSDATHNLACQPKHVSCKCIGPKGEQYSGGC